MTVEVRITHEDGYTSTFAERDRFSQKLLDPIFLKPGRLDLPTMVKERLNEVDGKLSEKKKQMLTYPCGICLVLPACSTSCIKLHRFLNVLASQIKMLTTDEWFYLRNHTSAKLIEIAVKMEERGFRIEISKDAPQ